MELTGRLTANAIVSTLKDERQVVNFTIAINDYYKPKGASEGKQVTQYINCSYWLGTGVAALLSRGTLVEVSGRLYATAFVSKDGEPKASLNVHCNRIKVHRNGAKKTISSEPEPLSALPSEQQATSPTATQPEDDIPF